MLNQFVILLKIDLSHEAVFIELPKFELRITFRDVIQKFNKICKNINILVTEEVKLHRHHHH